MAPWTAADIPDLTGRTAVVTGANSGLGFQTARMLAKRGATVVLACRSLNNADAAAERIRATAPDAELRTVWLNLASLDSVRTAAEKLRADHDRIDLLVNNAGAPSVEYRRTVDGFETTFATNHLGPFAFTGLLLDRIAAVPGGRIVTVSSVTHKRATIEFDDLDNVRREYRYMVAYSQSKLANLLFTFELQRRLASAGAAAIAVAAHPGAAQTGLVENMGKRIRQFNNATLVKPVSRLLQQPAAAGALPTVRAAVDPTVQGGEYYGPAGFFGLKGAPVRVAAGASALDREAQLRLWRESESLTGVRYST
ncbi:oxidoreductase [Nocardia sp. NPDC127579]|uniref:oxidoreductase n=1 Tax=Nocardia sp. NPDC127579 TaxID=3345402 RepID=UPI00363606EA